MKEQQSPGPAIGNGKAGGALDLSAQSFTPARPPVGKNLPPAFGCFARPKPMTAFAHKSAWLICPFHVKVSMKVQMTGNYKKQRQIFLPLRPDGPKQAKEQRLARKAGSLEFNLGI